MDTHVNKVFKQRMRQQWVTWFQTAATNKNVNLVQQNRQHVINWVSHAWDSVQDSTIIGAFLSCGLSNSLSGSEDSMMSRRLREDVGIDLQQLDEDLQDELDATRAHGILNDESDDETLMFGGFDPDTE